ncbi:DsrE family protein [Roseovarius sp. SCSIO 43702]|uniref:DsrE family protein n=1 Tax=Roseovarius sp. SCSIO 43702 TaxID=2823043 RepID=UPI001C72F525|nr:DsrE family protein [Roseovarius sp. SCSIO 43702]QYX57414.1 DsrE family protein [Roseovarius sp. SCSIO 43702]
MRKTLSALALSASVATPALADGPDNLVTVVTSDQPQVQLMSMVLSTQAIAQGHKVRILLCGAAGDMALVDARETATAGQPPRDMSPQGLLKAAIEKGATVEVCAIYLPGRGADPSALIDGVGVASPPDMAGALLADDTVVWSF